MGPKWLGKGDLVSHSIASPRVMEGATYLGKALTLLGSQNTPFLLLPKVPLFQAWSAFRGSVM